MTATPHPAQNPAEAKNASIELLKTLSAVNDRRIDILRRIGETGSISEAARTFGISYKAAWQAIENLENLAGGKLAEKSVGGQHGGGTKLTETGKQVIEISNRLAQAKALFLNELSLEEKTLAMALTPGSLLTSMRNTLPCTVESVHHGPALAKVTLRLDEHNVLKASITLESAQILGLKPGVRMLAAMKATAVDIARKFPGLLLDNRICGTVQRCSRSTKGGEVSLRLSNGLVLVGFAKRGHGLRPGLEAEATVPANAIVIANLP